MASSPTAHCKFHYYKTPNKHSDGFIRRQVLLSQQDNNKRPRQQIARRELILKTSELAVIGAIFNLSKGCSGMQWKKARLPRECKKNQQALSLCRATKNCISTSENISDIIHYTPPWNYNGGRKNPVSREVAMEELIHVIKSTKPDKYTPRIVEQKDDYLCVEYQSPILGFVDDVEFWFRPGNKSIVEYRSASRIGNFDFDVNRKRIKTLRLALEKKGWASEETF